MKSVGKPTLRIERVKKCFQYIDENSLYFETVFPLFRFIYFFQLCLLFFVFVYFSSSLFTFFVFVYFIRLCLLFFVFVYFLRLCLLFFIFVYFLRLCLLFFIFVQVSLSSFTLQHLCLLFLVFVYKSSKFVGCYLFIFPPAVLRATVFIVSMHYKKYFSMSTNYEIRKTLLQLQDTDDHDDQNLIQNAHFCIHYRNLAECGLQSLT